MRRKLTSRSLTQDPEGNVVFMQIKLGICVRRLWAGWSFGKSVYRCPTVAQEGPEVILSEADLVSWSRRGHGTSFKGMLANVVSVEKQAEEWRKN